jgi:uncharacterized protein YbjT (DUF2867 family)
MGEPSGRALLLAGATGLVGRECLSLLLEDPGVASVAIIVRRPVSSLASLPRLKVHIVDFDQLDADVSMFYVDQVICALGTTIREAGSQEAFRKVDFEYPLKIARLAREHGAHHFLIVSSLGADAGSRVFYNRVKGELEEAIRRIGYPSMTVVRPSLLLGQRSKRRFGEEIAKLFTPFTPPSVRPVHARRVAAALVNAAREDRVGSHLIVNRGLHALSQILLEQKGPGFPGP